MPSDAGRLGLDEAVDRGPETGGPITMGVPIGGPWIDRVASQTSAGTAMRGYQDDPHLVPLDTEVGKGYTVINAEQHYITL